MKHLLLILSFLLLSSPLFGQSKKKGLLYIWENGSRYVGEWKDGKKHGQGTYSSGKGEGEGDKYVGEFKDDKPNGQGTYTWPDGRKYEGKFKDGIQNGQAKYTNPNGEVYVGKWKNGLRHGKGSEQLSI